MTNNSMTSKFYPSTTRSSDHVLLLLAYISTRIIQQLSFLSTESVGEKDLREIHTSYSINSDIPSAMAKRRNRNNNGTLRRNEPYIRTITYFRMDVRGKIPNVQCTEYVESCEMHGKD
jgi:hypothetical protein